HSASELLHSLNLSSGSSNLSDLQSRTLCPQLLPCHLLLSVRFLSFNQIFHLPSPHALSFPSVKEMLLSLADVLFVGLSVIKNLQKGLSSSGSPENLALLNIDEMDPLRNSRKCGAIGHTMCGVRELYKKSSRQAKRWYSTSRRKE
ncbi:hypothetical protein CEXT_526271, partial [Caerostris extrusa]